MKWEGEVKRELEAILEEYFPKGDADARRGEGLMLFAMAMSLLRKTIKAFGGCDKCYGKGYGTQTLNTDDGYMTNPLPMMVFCGCDRGKQLERLFENGGKL